MVVVELVTDLLELVVIISQKILKALSTLTPKTFLVRDTWLQLQTPSTHPALPSTNLNQVPLPPTTALLPQVYPANHIQKCIIMVPVGIFQSELLHNMILLPALGVHQCVRETRSWIHTLNKPSTRHLPPLTSTPHHLMLRGPTLHLPTIPMRATPLKPRLNLRRHQYRPRTLRRVLHRLLMLRMRWTPLVPHHTKIRVIYPAKHLSKVPSPPQIPLCHLPNHRVRPINTTKTSPWSSISRSIDAELLVSEESVIHAISDLT